MEKFKIEPGSIILLLSLVVLIGMFIAYFVDPHWLYVEVWQSERF